MLSLMCNCVLPACLSVCSSLPAMFSATLKLLFTPNVTPRDRMMTPLFGGIRAMSNPGWYDADRQIGFAREEERESEKF